MVIELLAGLARGAAIGAVVGRARPYLLEARWRQGPLGSPLPRAPRRLPAPNPAVQVGTAPERRVNRAAQLRATVRRPPYQRRHATR